MIIQGVQFVLDDTDRIIGYRRNINGVDTTFGVSISGVPATRSIVGELILAPLWIADPTTGAITGYRIKVGGVDTNFSAPLMASTGTAPSGRIVNNVQFIAHQASGVIVGYRVGNTDYYAPIGASFATDFRTASLDSRITFTRGSAATRINASGVIESVLSNVARFDYDPVTLACRGLLIEEQRTNLLLWSRDFDNAAWTKERATISANVAVTPDGTVSGDKLLEDTTASATHTVYQAVAGLTDNTVHVAPFFLKAGERTKALVAIMDKAATTRGMLFDLSAGTVSSYNSGGITDPSYYGIQALADGWYCCYVAHSVGSGGSNPRAWVQLHNGTSHSYTGNGASGIYLWQADFQAGAFPTSPIYTTSAQVTRTADLASMTGTNFSSWYRQDEGTFVVTLDTYDAETPTSQVFLEARQDGSNALSMYVQVTDGFIANNCVVGGAAQAQLGVVNLPDGSAAFNNAFAYKANDFASTYNGNSAISDTSGTLPFPTALYLGNRGDAARPLNGHIARLAYYPARLSNSALQALSA